MPRATCTRDTHGPHAPNPHFLAVVRCGPCGTPSQAWDGFFAQLSTIGKGCIDRELLTAEYVAEYPPPLLLGLPSLVLLQLSWFKMASTLSDDTAPSASLDCLEAQGAPTQPRAPPEPLGSLPWPQEPASGRPKVEDFPLSTTRRDADYDGVAGASPDLPRISPDLPPRCRS